MISEKDENHCEASESLFILNADDITRQKCRARQDELRWKEKTERKIDTLTAENAALVQRIDALVQENAALKKLLAQKIIDTTNGYAVCTA